MSKNKLLTTIIGIILLIALSLVYWMFPDADNSDLPSNTVGVTQNEYQETLQIYFFNVGNADSTLIINKDEAMLIDGGNKLDAEYIYKYIKEELGYYNFKYIIATHADRDHIGGLPSIIENMNSVEKIFMPNTEKQTLEAKSMIDTATERNIPLIEPEIDSEYELGDAKFKIKWVATQTDGEKNENGRTINAVNENQSSIVIELEYGDNKFLFMGDYEKLAKTNKFYKEIVWDVVDLVRASHHGSKSGLIQGFYELTNPKYV